MALIDYRILQQNPGSMVGAVRDGYNQGMQANDAAALRRRQAEQEAQQRAQQQQEAQAQMRKQSFEQNARGLLSSYGEFAYTPEGRKGLLTDLTKAGFGPEAMGLFGQMDGVMPAKPAADEWKPLPGAGAPTLYRGGTGEVKTTGVAGKPAKPETPRAPVFKPGDDGFEHEWDPVARKFVRTNLKVPKDAPKPTGPKEPDMRGVFEMEQKLAKDFTTKAEKSIGVATAYNKIDASIKQNNPLDAYNAIVQFVKIIDPGTAAREGEVKSAVLSSAGGVGDRLIQAAKSAYNGTLDPTTAANIIQSARALMGAEKKTFDAYRAETKHKIKSYNARGYKLDEGAILGDYEKLFSGGQAPATGGGFMVGGKRIANPTEADIDAMTPEEFDLYEQAQ